jgi:hypothetical protein
VRPEFQLRVQREGVSMPPPAKLARQRRLKGVDVTLLSPSVITKRFFRISQLKVPRQFNEASEIRDVMSFLFSAIFIK